jgi:hypothetical protein
MKAALRDSFVGAIAIGYLLGEGVEQIAIVLASPISQWVQIKGIRWFSPLMHESEVSLQGLVPRFFDGLFFILCGWVLLRWLYYPAEMNAPSAAPSEGDGS